MLPAPLHNLAELEDGKVHGHHDTADERAQKHDDDGFHQAGEACDHVVHFGFIEVCGLAEHVVNGAGFFTDSAHL